jgi:thiol-disulfide isomerase/thioredoxin
MVAAAMTNAQPPTLRIGDPAPALEVMTWIKGRPVTRFEPGQVYVVEFWATWCPPCLRMMPRLSALQEKYSGRLTVVGVDARETERTDGSVEYVKSFVERKGDNMAYTVAMDDPVKHPVFDTWMGGGGSYGIPTTFVVDKVGRLVWVGHPLGEAEQEFNSVIEQALNGTSDLVAARSAQERVNRETAKRLKDATVLKPMREAQKQNDYRAVVAEADKVISQEADYGPELFWTRMRALLHVNEVQALAYVRDKARDPAYQRYRGTQDDLKYWGAVGAVIAGQDGLSKKSYQLALHYLEKLTAAKPDDYWGWTSLAKAQQQLRHLPQAIAAQERAIAAGQRIGLAEADIERLEKTLASYKAGAG